VPHGALHATILGREGDLGIAERAINTPLAEGEVRDVEANEDEDAHYDNGHEEGIALALPLALNLLNDYHASLILPDPLDSLVDVEGAFHAEFRIRAPHYFGNYLVFLTRSDRLDFESSAKECLAPIRVVV